MVSIDDFESVLGISYTDHDCLLSDVYGDANATIGDGKRRC
jgi:hypothetical protein